MNKQDLSTGQKDGILKFEYYTLESSGNLVSHPPTSDIKTFDSNDFIKHWWKVDLDNKADAYNLLIAAFGYGAKPEVIDLLAAKWGFTNEDCAKHVQSPGIEYSSIKHGFIVYGRELKSFKTNPYGIGDTLFEAVCEFVKKEYEAKKQ